MSNGQGLFREQVLAERRHRRDSAPLHLGSSPWRASAWLLAVMAAAVLAFLWLGEYTRKARAVGQVLPAWGLVRLHAAQSGVVMDMRVREGQRVRAGEALLVLRSERATAGGEVQREVLTKLDERRASLGRSQGALDALYRVRRKEAEIRHSELQAQLDSLARQVTLAEERVGVVEATLARQQRLLAEGFVSAAALDEKRAASWRVRHPSCSNCRWPKATRGARWHAIWRHWARSACSRQGGAKSCYWRRATA